MTGRRTWASDEEREAAELDALDLHTTQLAGLASGSGLTYGAAGDISQIDSGDTAAAGAVGKPADAGHQHALPTPGSPAASAVADTGAAGSSAKVAREDHKHAREAFGAQTALTTSGTGADGSATSVSHSDHRHAFPPEVPRGRMGRAAITTGSSTFTGTHVDITGLSVSFTAVSTRFYEIEFSGMVNSDVANDSIDIYIADGSGNEIKTARVRVTAAGGAGQQIVTVVTEVSGISGSVTYKIRAARAAGSGNCSVVASSVNPAEIIVKDTGGT